MQLPIAALAGAALGTGVAVLYYERMAAASRRGGGAGVVVARPRHDLAALAGTAGRTNATLAGSAAAAVLPPGTCVILDGDEAAANPMQSADGVARHWQPFMAEFGLPEAPTTVMGSSTGAGSAGGAGVFQVSAPTTSSVPLTVVKMGSPALVAEGGDNLFVRPGYISKFSPRLRIPEWVVETLHPPSPRVAGAGEAEDGSSLPQGAVSRDGVSFTSNFIVSDRFRASNADYAAKGGFSRGHLAAAQFHKSSQADMKSTFDLSLNAVPQEMSVNACDWFRLESLTKQLSKEFDRMHVITGPAFAWRHTGATVPLPAFPTGSGGGGWAPISTPCATPKGGIAQTQIHRRTVEYEVIGDHAVAVPTHLFKCLAGEINRTREVGTACFVVPNEPILDEQSLTAFQVSQDVVEQLVGANLFPRLAENGRPTYDICRRFNCDKSTYNGSFSKVQRHVGQLRAARSLPDLEERHRAALLAFGDQEKAVVEKAYDVTKGLILQRERSAGDAANGKRVDLLPVSPVRTGAWTATATRAATGADVR